MKLAEIKIIESKININDIYTIACYDPDKKVIYIGTGFYDFCMKFGEEALAAILAHELGHYYYSHQAIYTIQGFYLSTEKRKELEKELDLKKLDTTTLQPHETQADMFAAYRCLLAGYDIESAMPKILEETYNLKNLGDGQIHEDYLPLDKRKLISKNAIDKIKKLIPLINAGKYLYILGEYELAAKCYDNVQVRGFDSWEIFYNAAISYTLAITDYLNDNKKFIYPFEIQSNSLISKYRTNELSSKGADSKGNIDVSETIQRLTETAKNRFYTVKSKQPDISILYILNNACLDYISGNIEEAISNIKNIPDDIEDLRTKFLVSLAKGIIYSEDTKVAEMEFDKAAKYEFECFGHTGFVDYNRNILRGKQPDILSAGFETSFIGNETICGYVISKMLDEVDFNTVHYPETKVGYVKYRQINVGTYSGDRCKAYEIEIENKIYHFIETMPCYNETTLRGIKINDEVNNIQIKYGDPSRLVLSEDGEYYLYERSKIIFKVRDSKVVGWMLFEMK